MNGEARIEELVLLAGRTAARISCDPALIPSPGRYVLVHEAASAALVSSALFLTERTSGGFIAAPPIPSAWKPGSRLSVRGPLGHGFTLPAQARRVALSCIGVDASRLLPLAEAALQQRAAVTLVCDDPPSDLPLQLEVQPVPSLREVCAWSDYAAHDVEQHALEEFVRRWNESRREMPAARAEVLVRAPMPCGGAADCGVCSIRTPEGVKLTCVEGPVFDLKLLLGRS